MWTKELVELLIIKYQEHENLYDVRNPLYLDRVKRSNSLFSICQELKTLNTNITIGDIKKKIHTLRAQFIKESRAIANSIKSGVGVEDIYVPRLWCFPQLQFLKSHCTLRKSESNIPETDESDNGFLIDTDTSGVNSENKAQPSCKKRERDFNLDEEIENVKKMIINKSEQKNRYGWLGEQVVFQISKMKNEQIQQDAVWNIQQILRQALVKDKQSEPQPSCSFLTSPPDSTLFAIQQLKKKIAQNKQSLNTTSDVLHQELTLSSLEQSVTELLQMGVTANPSDNISNVFDIIETGPVVKIEQSVDIQQVEETKDPVVNEEQVFDLPQQVENLPQTPKKNARMKDNNLSTFQEQTERQTELLNTMKNIEKNLYRNNEILNEIKDLKRKKCEVLKEIIEIKKNL